MHPVRSRQTPGAAKSTDNMAVHLITQSGSGAEQRTYQGNHPRDDDRPGKDEDPPSKEELDRDRDNGTHDRDEEPAVVDLGEALGVAVVVDEDLEGDTGDQSGLYPLEREHTVY